MRVSLAVGIYVLVYEVDVITFVVVCRSQARNNVHIDPCIAQKLQSSPFLAFFRRLPMLYKCLVDQDLGTLDVVDASADVLIP